MASTFDAQFSRAGFPNLLRQFGEPVTYWPREGGSRPIDAIIERDPPTIFNAAGEVVLPEFVLRVNNSSKSGIASTEIDTGGDEIEFKENVDDVKPSKFMVGQVVSQDAGVLRFTVV